MASSRCFIPHYPHVSHNGGVELPTEIVVALLALVGTLTGSFTGVMASNKLTNFRIQELERKVEKHNNLVERMAAVESSVKSAHHRLDELHEKLEKEE